MSGNSTPPGWYHAEGDHPNTNRWWSGTEWVGGPQVAAQPVAAGFPGAPQAIADQRYVRGELYPDRSPLAWYKLAFTRYVDFEGRSRRKEYWWFFFFNILIATILIAVGILASDFENEEISVLSIVCFAVLGLYFLATMIPSIAIAIRRLHDTNKSGWWYLIGVIPIVNYIGGLVLLVFYCLDSHPQPNQWGRSPKH